VGLVLGGLHRPFNHHLIPKHFLGYMAFLPLQQVGLNSYVTNRLLAATESPVGASLIAGTIFAGPSLPESCTRSAHVDRRSRDVLVFARERNILPLTLASHFGQSGLVAISGGWHHAIARGPRFYHFLPR